MIEGFIVAVSLSFPPNKSNKSARKPQEAEKEGMKEDRRRIDRFAAPNERRVQMARVRPSVRRGLTL